MTLQKINKITISNWRSWKGETTLDKIGDGLIVLNGPNAIGKSGVWEAIVAGLLDKHRGTHTDRLRPIGSAGLIPMVEIDFSANGKEYRIRKRFSKQLASSEATLYKHSKGSWKLIEDNPDEAFLKCRQIVAGTEATDISRGGFENAVKDNLMQVLLPIQGSLVELTRAPPSIAGLSVDKVMAASATQLGRILGNISNDMTMWHKNRKQLVKSDLMNHLDRLEQIKEEIVHLEENSARIENYVNTIRSVSEDLENVGDASNRLQEANILQSEAEEHRQKRERAKEVLDDARKREKNLRELCDNRNSVLTTIKESEESIEKIKKDYKSAKSQLKVAQENLEKLQQRRDIKKEEDTSLRQWLDYETREARLAEIKLNLSSVQSRLETVDTVKNELDKLNQSLANLILPDKKSWKKWDQLDERFKEAKGKKDAESWQITGSLPNKFKLIIDGQEVRTKEISILAAKKIEIISPNKKHHFNAMISSLDTESYEKIEEEVTEFFKRFDVTSIDELRVRHSQAMALNEKIKGTKSQISTALNDNTRDELVKEIGRLSGELTKWKSLKTPISKKPNGEPGEWQIRREIAERDIESIQSDIDDARQTLGSLIGDKRASETRQAELMEKLQENIRQLDTHQNEFGEDDKIKEALEVVIKEVSEAEKVWSPLEKIKKIAEDQKLKTAKNLREALTEIITKQQSISSIEGKLSELRQDDPEGKLISLRAEQSRLMQIVASEQVNADALLLLERIMQKEFQKHTEAVGGPIHERIQTWLRYILQDDSELLISEDGLPTKIRNPTSQEIEFKEQSFGTKEQISVLYRLAIASLIAEQSGSGVCLMFDDPFGYTDKGRRRRMLEIIEEEVNKHKHQVLMFTCRPEDFVGCGNHRTLIGGTEV